MERDGVSTLFSSVISFNFEFIALLFLAATVDYQG